MSWIADQGSPDRDYGYTKAFVKKLVKELGTEAGWNRLIGTSPRRR
jgi:hypothetical protein